MRTTHETQMVILSKVKPDPNNPRKKFEGIEELAENIRTQGIIHPIEVDENYIIVVGERRYRACQALHLVKIPVIIHDQTLTPYERLVRQMSENLHQSAAKNGDSMNPVDTAEAWTRLYQLKTKKKLKIRDFDFSLQGKGVIQLNGTMEKIIKDVGGDKKTVWRLLEILNEPKFVRTAIKNKKLPYSYIEELARAPEEIKSKLRKRIVRGDYKGSREMRDDIQVYKKIPELGQLTRNRQKESSQANRLLNGITRLGLALEAVPLTKINPKERNVVADQLDWIIKMIDKYLIEDITPHDIT